MRSRLTERLAFMMEAEDYKWLFQQARESESSAAHIVRRAVKSLRATHQRTLAIEAEIAAIEE